MTNRAVLVGSQTGNLAGPIGDAKRMADALDARGFEIDLRVEPDQASRDGIIAGYRALIEQTQPGDVAVFYYSGHGVRVLPAGTPDPDARQSLQSIVPTDFAASTPDAFCGITDVELSVLLAELTRRTTNATVIFDCCHAAAMSRDVESRPKALFHPTYLDFAHHLTRIAASGFDVGLLAATGNTNAVRLVAAGESQSAYERFVGDHAVGTFTESLLLALEDAHGQRVTWDMIGRTVRERVLGIHPTQRVDIEGPRRRYLFEVEEAPRAGAITIVAGDEPQQAILRAGKVHGVHEGDEYTVVSNGTVTTQLAIAKVARVGATAATAGLRFISPATQLPPVAEAILLRSAAAKRVVRLIADSPARAVIAAAIEGTGRFTLIEREAPSLLATVTLRDHQLELISPSGLAVIPATSYSEDSLKRLVINLRMLAAAQGVRELRSDDDGELPDTAVEVTWGTVEQGAPSSAHRSGPSWPSARASLSGSRTCTRSASGSTYRSSISAWPSASRA